MAGERKAADINRVTENYNVAKTVDIHMPYDTKADGNGSYKFTPTFTKAYESAEITFVDKNGEKQELVSGTEYDLGKMIALTANENLNDKTVNLTVEYSERKTETWTLSFDVPSQDPWPPLRASPCPTMLLPSRDATSLWNCLRPFGRPLPLLILTPPAL